MNKRLRATEVAHQLLKEFVSTGSTVLDATAGNGYDTMFLAQTVGRQGKVFAFDIQQTALAETGRRLQANDCFEQVELILDSHEHLERYVKAPVAAIVYNLGYLPGTDKTVMTQSAATLRSLKAGLELLAPGGILLVTTYPGHPGGDDEAELVEAYIRELPCPPWHVLSYKKLNGMQTAPCLLIVQKEGNR